MASFTDTEKAEIQRYLGYVNWKSIALAGSWDFPYGIEPEYWVRDVLANKISDVGMDLIRKDLDELRCIESQMSDCRKRLKAIKIGNMQINNQEFDNLRTHMTYWTKRLMDDLGGRVARSSSGVGLSSSRCGRVIG